MRQTPELRSSNSDIWKKHDGSKALLPLYGVQSRAILVGGGGAGKTTIINFVLTPVLEEYYGRDGLQKEAPSNKAARGINGVTVHVANNLRGNSSLLTPHLRQKPRQTAYVRRQGRQGARVYDEFSQLNSKLWHADMYMTSVARNLAWEAAEQASELQGQDLRPDPARYTDLDQSWGAMPVVVVAGDELQFPCVPAAAGLLAPIIGTSDEQKAAVKCFTSFQDVYKLRTQKRFTDPVLINILEKMRRKGGCKLTSAEWERLESTEVEGGDLSGTEHWFEAAYEWSIVTLATVVRSQLSASSQKTPLFVVQAEDQFLSAIDAGHVRDPLRDAAAFAHISHEVLQHPSMNETGRLPSFCMFHVGMRVRFTQTVESGLVVVDQTGVVVGLDFHENEPVENKEALELRNKAVQLLRHFPTLVYVKLDRANGDTTRLRFLDDEPCARHQAEGVDAECDDCREFSDVVAVEPSTNRPAWSLRIKSLDVTVKVKRVQLPFVCAGASTEHVLQGTTCDPGLLFHWKFPRRMKSELRWLGIYVALSRVRSLDSLKSIGLTKKIREDIERGPPDGILERFEMYFGKKIEET